MRVQDLMTADVKTVSPTAPAEDAWNEMRLKGIKHLVVVKGRRAVGVLSDRDAGGDRGGCIRMNRTVGDLMTTPAATIHPTATVRQAANVMRSLAVGCLVVVESGRIIGIVTVSDLLELVGRGLDRGAQTTKRWTLKHRVPHRKSKGAAGVW
jgi:signal-transduction protein with cAMP-binding, CBS, and nucleotidyltransferase domain